MSFGRTTIPAALRVNALIAMRPIRQPLREVGQWTLFIGQTIWFCHLLSVSTAANNTSDEQSRMGAGLDYRRWRHDQCLVILGIALGASMAIEAFAILNLLGFGALSGITAGVERCARSARWWRDRLHLAGRSPNDGRDRRHAHLGGDRRGRCTRLAADSFVVGTRSSAGWRS